MHFLSLPVAAVLAAAPALAQDLCEGNGFGGAYVEVGPAYLGGLYRHDVGSPNVPNGICFFSISDGFQETVHPLAGPICLDVFSPFYDVIVLPTGPDGNLHFELYLPDVPSWVGNPPFYSNVTTIEGGQLSISKTVPLWFENPDSWTPVAPMNEARILHTATYLGEDGRDDRIRILIAGGSTGTVTVPVGIKASTEIFDPLSRTFSAGPDLSVARAAHTATRLPDGRVLIAGGVGPDGLGHASAELFDLSTGTITPASPMTAPRLGHTATLLEDGRVLVLGGFAQYQDPASAWEAALDSAQASGEIYDPATGAWTPLATSMASPRAGHSATLLADGRVLVAGGVSHGFQGVGPWGPGGIVPGFTSSTELFVPGPDAFTASGALPFGRAFHGASQLASGHVLISGGTYTGGLTQEAVSTVWCDVWDGSAWSTTAPLTESAAAWLAQLPAEDGGALILGGLSVSGSLLLGISAAYEHDGVALTPLSPIGVNEGLPRSAPVGLGASAVVRMHDGSVLVAGGLFGSIFAGQPTAEALVYTPPKP